MLLPTTNRRGGRAALWLVVGLLIGGAAGAGTMYVLKQGKKGIPGTRLGAADELKLVPADAAGFVHIRVRDSLDTHAFADVRQLLTGIGADATKTLDETFVPAPSTIDRITVVSIRAPEQRQPKPPADPTARKPAPVMDTVTVLALTAPVDRSKVQTAYLKTPTERKHADKTYWVNPEATEKNPKPGALAVYFPNDTTLVVGHPDAVTRVLGWNPSNPGPLSKPLEHAAEGGRHIVAAFNPTAFESDLVNAFRDAPDELKPVLTKANVNLRKVQSVAVLVAAAEETKVEVRATYRDEAGATEGEEAVRELIQLARDRLAEHKKKQQEQLKSADAPGPRPLSDFGSVLTPAMILAALGAVDDGLAAPPLSRDGAELVLKPRLPAYLGMNQPSVAIFLAAPFFLFAAR